MSQEQPPQSQKQRPQSQKKVTGPSEIMSPEAFAQWMPFATSPEVLTPERLALLKRMSDDLAQNPAFLRMIERMLADYGDEIYRISPSDADLSRGGFGWTARPGDPVVGIVPAAAAAALAPPAAALAAAHAPGE